MRTCIYIISAVLSLALMTRCSKNEQVEGQQVGSSLNKNTVPEGHFVVTFSIPGTRAEADFNPITGEDERVFDLRYLIYDAEGNFVKDRLIFDDFDADADDTQDWPLPSITDTLPVGHYRAVFVTNTDPDIFRELGNPNPMPDDLLVDYELGFDEARLHLPYLLGADDPDFFMDVIEFSHEDPSETVYLQRIVGIFKVYRSLIDAQEALNKLVADLVGTIDADKILSDQVLGLLQDNFGGAVGGVLDTVLDPLGPLPVGTIVNVIVGVLLDDLLDALVDPIVDAVYDLLLQRLIDEVGGILEGNDESDLKVLDLLDMLLNPWFFADGALVTVENQPTEFGFDMEVKARDPAARTFHIPIVDADTAEGERKVVITKYLGFVDLDNDSAGEQLMRINSINTAIPGLVGGLLLDGTVENYILPGALFDIEDPLDFNAPNNLQASNEYSLLDLGIDDSVQKQEKDLTISLETLDVANLNDALYAVVDGLLNKLALDLPVIGEISLNGLLGMVGSSVELLTQDLLTELIGGGADLEGGLTDLSISVPISLPLLTLSDLNVSGSWDPYNTLEVAE